MKIIFIQNILKLPHWRVLGATRVLEQSRDGEGQVSTRCSRAAVPWGRNPMAEGVTVEVEKPVHLSRSRTDSSRSRSNFYWDFMTVVEVEVASTSTTLVMPHSQLRAEQENNKRPERERHDLRQSTHCPNGDSIITIKVNNSNTLHWHHRWFSTSLARKTWLNKRV
jgi:hypothetical protein